jgi:hypothetical protein
VEPLSGHTERVGLERVCPHLSWDPSGVFTWSVRSRKESRKAFGTSYCSASSGHVEWIGQDKLLYKELHFSMAQFQGMVHGLASESRRLLTEELLFSSVRVRWVDHKCRVNSEEFDEEERCLQAR